MNFTIPSQTQETDFKNPNTPPNLVNVIMKSLFCPRFTARATADLFKQNYYGLFPE
jgi:hypothetical protein